MTVRGLLGIVAAAAVARGVIAAAFPLLPDEAYYWVWAHHLDLSYPDHPPMIAYLVAVGTLAGDAPFWVRAVPLAVGLATTYALFGLGCDLFDARAGLAAAALYQAVPILWLGGLLATPDAPLYLAWTLTAWFAWRALRRGGGWWLAAGAAAGLGLLSKLFMACLLAGLALYLVLRARPALRTRELAAAALLAGLLCLPVVSWNVRHGFAGVRFLLAERPRWGSGAAGLRALVSPHLEFVLLAFPAFVWALWSAWRRRAEAAYAYVFWTVAPAIAATILTALWGIGRGAWLGPVYLELAVVLGALRKPWVHALAWGTAALAAVFFARALVPGLPPPPLPVGFAGWGDAATRVAREAAAAGPDAPVATDNYEIASRLRYASRGTLDVLLVPRPDWAVVWPPLPGGRAAQAVAVTYGPLKWTACLGAAEQIPLQSRHPGDALSVLRLYRLRDFAPARCRCDRCCPYCPWGITR
jgi:4-amino-4-deoxy-L-arabinose transferase-like glycosyltransferase